MDIEKHCLTETTDRFQDRRVFYKITDIDYGTDSEHCDSFCVVDIVSVKVSLFNRCSLSCIL